MAEPVRRRTGTRPRRCPLHRGTGRRHARLGMVAGAGSPLRILPVHAVQENSWRGGGEVSDTHTPPPDSGARIVFENVSRFYGEVLGVNRVKLAIPPGITSLVGPNGSGKTTLMNLLCGLIQPTEGRITVNGIPSDRPQDLFRHVGYCTQVDHFPRGLSGYDFIYYFLRCHGYTHAEGAQLTATALERLDMTAPASRAVGGYSKG